MSPITQRAEQLPPMATVATLLRTTSERLAGELSNPQAAPPDWSEVEWHVARAVAAMHGISGLLAEKLLWHGPEGWGAFLSRQHEHIAHRQLRIHELLSTLGERFRQQGIPVLALKGAALHLAGLYQRGQRPMADIDLLTVPQHTERASAILETLGMRESERNFKNRTFEARDSKEVRTFGEHADNAVTVDLHERICEPLPYRLTDISQWVYSAQGVPGINPYPSQAALMAHLLLHAAGGMAYRTLRLVQLHDIALLGRRLGAPDWQQLLEWRPWWAWPPLVLTGRYYGAVTPEKVILDLRALCPPILRRAATRQILSDVSLSRLWLEAFPGIEWARTPGEAAAFIARRIVPSAEVRAQREFALTTDPSLAQGDWGGLSQGRRILRALRARTPRPWPLHNVREALGETR